MKHSLKIPETMNLRRETMQKNKKTEKINDLKTLHRKDH